MNKTITLYEYDKLTTSHDHFDEVKMKALLKINELHGGKYLDGLSNGVRFKQYVGVIQVDGLTIEILPKADQDEGHPKWRNVLIKMLQKTGNLKLSTAGAAHVNRQNLNLLEIYFELFLNEIISLQRIGLIKKYRKESKNIMALKGKLEFAGQIRHNLIHKERFYTTHQIYDQDHKLHQILFVALEIVQLFTNGTRLSDLCNRVLFHFPEVMRIKVNEQLLSTVILNRKSNKYRYAMELARLIILNYSPAISQGKNRMLAILFDMNNLWEKYILTELRKIQETHGLIIGGQEQKYIWESNYLKPDIVISKGSVKYLIDTKWKRPGNSPSSVDIRQMYAYARFWNAERVMLLYPGVEKTEFKSFLNTDNDGLHQCKMGFVSVLNGKQLSDDVGVDVLKAIGLLDSK